MTKTTTPPKDRRTWHYLEKPKQFEFAPCACGNHDTVWSEWAGHLWCPVCEVDFIPKHSGLLEGPVMTQTLNLLGVCLDRYNMETNQVEFFDHETGQFTTE